MTEKDKWIKAREDHMRLRGIIRLDRKVYTRAMMRKFVADIKKYKFYDYHNPNGEVVFKFDSEEQKERLMNQIKLQQILFEKNINKK